MHKLATSLALATVATGVLAGCGQGAGGSSTGTSSFPSPSSSRSASASSSGVRPGSHVTESNPPGDIPDTQAYVRYTPTGRHFSVKIPEGWSRSTSGATTTFTSKLNSVRITAAPAGAAPTTGTARAKTVPMLKRSVPQFQAGRISTVKRGGQSVVRIDYQGDSAPDPVTGKVVRDAFETYLYYRSGTLLKVTLIGPVNADNVDPWRIVSDSVRWH